jgi:exonuclease VII small subunit
MKTENILAEIKSKSLKEARDEINEILTKLESYGTELNNYSHEYQRLIQLNKHVEELFKKKNKEISSINEVKQGDTKKIK